MLGPPCVPGTGLSSVWLFSDVISTTTRHRVTLSSSSLRLTLPSPGLYSFSPSLGASVNLTMLTLEKARPTFAENLIYKHINNNK